MGGKHMAAGTSFESRLGFMLSLCAVAAIIVTAMVVFPEVDENDPEVKHLMKEMDKEMDINLIQDGRRVEAGSHPHKRSNKLSQHQLTKQYIKSTKMMYSSVGKEINNIVGGTEKAEKPAQRIQQVVQEESTEQKVSTAPRKQRVSTDAATASPKAASTATQVTEVVQPPQNADAEQAAAAAYEASASKTTGNAMKSIAQDTPSMVIPEDTPNEVDHAPSADEAAPEDIPEEAPEEMLLQIDDVVEEPPAVAAFKDDPSHGAAEVLSQLDNTLKALEGAKNSAIWDTENGGDELLEEDKGPSQRRLKARLQAKAKKKMAETHHKAAKKAAKIKKREAEKLKKKKERALKKVVGAVKLKHTGKTHLQDVIKRGKQRVELRMMRAQRRVWNARTHAIRKMEGDGGGLAAIKAARDVRNYVKDTAVREVASKQKQVDDLKAKMRKMKTRALKDRLRSKFRIKNDVNKYKDRLERIRDDVAVARDRYLQHQSEEESAWAFGAPPGQINNPLPPSPTEGIQTDKTSGASVSEKAMLKRKYQKMMAALKAHNAPKSAKLQQPKSAKLQQSKQRRPTEPAKRQEEEEQRKPLEPQVEELLEEEEPWMQELRKAEAALSASPATDQELLGLEGNHSSHHGHNGFDAAFKVQHQMLRSMARRADRWKKRAHDAGRISAHDVTVAKAAATAAADASDAERGASAVSGSYTMRALDKNKIQSDYLNHTHPYISKHKRKPVKIVATAVAKAIASASKTVTKPVLEDTSVLVETQQPARGSVAKVVDSALDDVACPECGQFAMSLLAKKKKSATIPRAMYEAEVAMEQEQEKMRRNAEAQTELLQEENQRLQHKIQELTSTIQEHGFHLDLTHNKNGASLLH